MGTLSPPFILCPLSDRKDLLGMSEDRLQNKVIITIGRNIAIRYHILEQKQETSWTISRHWLTSRVVFCPELEKYGAVVDHTAVALWDEGDTVLNRITKYKFNEPVLELRPTRTLGTLIVFENGFVLPLAQVMEKKNVAVAEGRGVVDTTSEVILNLEVDEKAERVVLVIAQKSGDKKAERHIQMRKSLKVITVKLPSRVKVEKLDKKAGKKIEIVSEFEIQPENFEIVGHCILSDEDFSFLYVGSDGRLYQRPLFAKGSDPPTSSVIGYLGKHVSVKTAVVIRVVENGSTLIIYGSDPSEEGAVVFLFDVKYDLMVAKQSLKLYGTPPIMDRIGGNVIVPVGMHILVLGFKASKSKLSSVVGKHQIRSGEEVFEERSPWGVSAPEAWDVDKDAVHKSVLQKRKKALEVEQRREMNKIKTSFPDCWEIVHQFKILEREGQPEASICNQIIPMALETKNLAGLDWILEAITDIPEPFLITILSHLLSQLEPPKITKKKTPPTVAVSVSPSTGNPPVEIETEHLVYSADARLNRLLLRNVDEKGLIHSLPTLDYERVRQLVEYLKSMMDQFWLGEREPDQNGQNDAESGENVGELREVEASCWMKWISALLDAHYTKFVFNNEIQLVEEILGMMEERAKVMEAIEDLEPYLVLTYNKVKFEPCPNPNSKWRSEIITFV